jgi:hypothetical protein
LSEIADGNVLQHESKFRDNIEYHCVADSLFEPGRLFFGGRHEQEAERRPKYGPGADQDNRRL